MKDRFFVYCNESGFELFETLDDALDAANERIQGYLEDAWSDEVTSVCAGKITHRAKVCDQVFPDGEIDEGGIDEAGDYWDPEWEYKCNYKMLPVEPENPADDVTKLVEPTAWLVREKTFCGDVTTNKDAAEFCEQLSPNSTTPLYAHPQQAPEIAKLVESLEVAHRFIANGIELGYIQMPDSDTLDPAHETLPAIEAALAEYRAQCGDV